MQALAHRLIRAQWPFWLGGVAVGLTEILFYSRYDHFIPVTTGLAQMYAASEHYLFGLDWLSRVSAAGIHWIIVGAVLGAWIVARMEGESRAWVRYHPRMLAMAFVGGVLFSFGTRIAGGCTAHHFLGGIPAMNISSWAVLLSGIPFAFLALLAASFRAALHHLHAPLRSILSHNTDELVSPAWAPGAIPMARLRP
jgi:uncharacterized membrane protein YedE/YeeE